MHAVFSPQVKQSWVFLHTFKIWSDPGIVSWSSPHQLIQEIRRRHGFGGRSSCCFSFLGGCQAVQVEIKRRFQCVFHAGEGWGSRNRAVSILFLLKQDGYPCEFLMRLVSANLFAQPKHLQIQNPSCHQSRREMMSSENPSVSLGTVPWRATKLQMWTLALSSTGKIHSEISLGQQLLLNYRANSKEHTQCSDSSKRQVGSEKSGIWGLNEHHVMAQLEQSLWGCGGEGWFCSSVQPLLLVPAMQGLSSTQNWSVWSVILKLYTHIRLKMKGNGIFLGLVRSLGQKEWNHEFVEDKNLWLAICLLTRWESARSAGWWFGRRKSVVTIYTGASDPWYWVLILSFAGRFDFLHRSRHNSVPSLWLYGFCLNTNLFPGSKC